MRTLVKTILAGIRGPAPQTGSSGGLIGVLRTRPWWVVTGGLVAVGGFVAAFADNVSTRLWCLAGFVALQAGALLLRGAHRRPLVATAVVLALLGATAWGGVVCSLVLEWRRHPAVQVQPATGDHASIFRGTGSGFTPNGAVTVSATMPDGERYRATYAKTADAAGDLAWTWQWDPGDADGLWRIHFLDHGSGKKATATITIASKPVRSAGAPPPHPPHPPTTDPHVTVSPAAGDHSTLFEGTASGFTPNAEVTVSAAMPGGATYPHTYPKTADAGGAFTWSWRWDPGDPDGTWTIHFLDHASGKKATATITIASKPVRSAGAPPPHPPHPPTTDPHVTVSPAAGDHSTLFTGRASSFSRHGNVTVGATMPGGVTYPHTYPKTADASGAFTWSWRWDPGDPDGTWTIHFLDRASGKRTSASLVIAG
jgi:hypothetical protein